MIRSCVALVGLLAVFTAAKGFAQPVPQWGQPPTAVASPPSPQPLQTQPAGPLPQTQMVGPALQGPPDQPPIKLPFGGQSPPPQMPPSQIPPPLAPPSKDASSAAGDVTVAGETVDLEALAKAIPPTSLSGFMGYRYSAGALEWIPGGGNQFGMFSIDWDHYQKPGIAAGIGLGAGFHFLSGPDQTDMPARVYDFSLAGQVRQEWGPMKFDVAASVLAAGDFLGSVRKGFMYPGHAVGFYSAGPALDVVFGVDYLDRGDIKLLPVVGIIWLPVPDVRYELVFPRPRAVFQVTDHFRLYLAGELGGDTWEIERIAFRNDLATYRDLRLLVGVEHVEENGMRSAFEVGYLFDRRLLYASGVGNMNLDDAVVLRLVTTY